MAVNPAKDLLQASLLHLAGGGRRGGRPPAQQQQNGGKFRPNLELIPRALLFTGMESRSNASKQAVSARRSNRMKGMPLRTSGRT